MGLQADPGRRHDLRGQPGAARRGRGPAGEDPRQQPLRAEGRRPARAGHVRQQDQRAGRSWPASGRTSRPAATARRWPSTSPAPQRKWFTFTNGTHIDSLDPETFNRWYDFLELYVAQQAPITNSAAIQRRRAGHLPGGDGDLRRDAAARPDPGAADLRRARWPRSSSCRRSGCCSTTAPAARSPGEPLSRLRAVVRRASRSRARRRARGTSARAARSATKRRPARAPTRSRWNAHARPLTDFTGDTAAGTGGLWTATPPYKWAAAARPAPRSSYVTAPLTANTTVIGAGAVHAWVRSSTPERRPAGHDQRGPARRQGDVRPERLAARPASASSTRAKSTPLEPVLSLRGADVSPMPRKRFVEGHDPALLRGPRLPRRLAHPRDDHRAERRPADLVVRRDAAEAAPRRSRSRTPSACRRASSCRSCPA